MKNPLRYPGAKSKLAPYVKELLIKENLIGCTIYEPFAGSAAISFAMLEEGIINYAVINELDPLLFNFWISVFNYTEELILLIEKTDITIENWKKMKLYRDGEFLKDKSQIEIGFAGLFLNRTCFSGILNANPLGGIGQLSENTIDCRFNKIKIIENIRKLSLYKSRIKVYNMDAIDFINLELKYKRNKKTFVYIDPPYFEAGPSLYRFFYKEQNHKDLSKVLKKKAFPWLLSYDDSEDIKKLYKKNRYVNLYFDYTVRTTKKGKELLISNLEIPPVEIEVQKDSVS